jgi:protein-tyrosine phosphatase
MGSTREALKRVIRGPVRDLWWTFYGSAIHQSHLQKTTRSVLFICKGNICRSPFAEHLARKLTASGKCKLIIKSAGLQVASAEPSPFAAIEAAKKFDVDMTGHLSSALTHEQIESFDAIFAMEAWQLKKLSAEYVQHQKKFFLLPLIDNAVRRQFKGYQTYNIKDPYGGEMQEFVDCYKRIESCVRSVLSDITVI